MREPEIIILPDGTTFELDDEMLEEVTNNKGDDE